MTAGPISAPMLQNGLLAGGVSSLGAGEGAPGEAFAAALARVMGASADAGEAAALSGLVQNDIAQAAAPANDATGLMDPVNASQTEQGPTLTPFMLALFAGATPAAMTPHGGSVATGAGSSVSHQVGGAPDIAKNAVAGGAPTGADPASAGAAAVGTDASSISKQSAAASAAILMQTIDALAASTSQVSSTTAQSAMQAATLQSRHGTSKEAPDHEPRAATVASSGATPTGAQTAVAVAGVGAGEHMRSGGEQKGDPQSAPDLTPTAKTIDAPAGADAGKLDAAASADAPDQAAAPAPRNPAPLLAAIAGRVMRTADGGATSFDIRIAPPELGRIDAKLEIVGDGEATATITVERADTLSDMVRAAKELERAFADIGLKLSADAISFRMSGDGAGAWSRNDARSDAQQLRYGAARASNSEEPVREIGPIAERWRKARLDVWA